MLALTQPMIEGTAPGIDQWGLAPLWQLICRESGGRFPAHYLDIGLLGLRYLPDHSGGSEVPWLSGLANWALARKPSPEDFKAAWFALKLLYPRAPHRWRKLVGDLLSTRRFADAGIHASAWWDIDNDFAPMQKQNFVGSATLQSPFPDDCARVIDHLSKPFAVVEPRIDQLLSGHRRYLHATGNSEYIVRAIHSLGKALIARAADEPRRRSLKAQTLAREGLMWAPNDMYLWGLWFDALVADGSLQGAEMIGWEAIRRFPQNPDSRTQL
ncbi:MAG: hypothetical protein JWO56_1070, partial [Acidobacteria bacterium]|nr:hypothetical protein [Acidobacteriota bacterium]